MRVEITHLRAWVDGELDEPQASIVGTAVMFDKTLQQSAAKLRASRHLPYRQACEQSPGSAVPSRLRARVIKALQETDF